eukprot:TRINITY_DN2361_c0_g1_i4.p1 TRINITY_DN2361_c0_g1~~TRINITY_DN2361_c0_g1_i4.p1  ORF type:complete len:137 (+),score=3.80 TRINITY_DN2361_c0_g1_i4:253-663(+)
MDKEVTTFSDLLDEPSSILSMNLCVQSIMKRKQQNKLEQASSASDLVRCTRVQAIQYIVHAILRFELDCVCISRRQVVFFASQSRESGGDGFAFFVKNSRDVWSRAASCESLDHFFFLVSMENRPQPSQHKVRCSH